MWWPAPRPAETIRAQNERVFQALSNRGDQRIMQFIENALRGTPYECGHGSQCTWNLKDEQFIALLEAEAAREHR